MRKRTWCRGMGALVWMMALSFPTLGAWSFMSLVAPASAQAQDEGDEEEEEESDEKADAAAAGGGESEAAQPEVSMLAWFYKALGPEYTIPFLAISFYYVALLVMMILAARREVFLPSHLIQGFEAHLNEKRYQEAFDLAKNDPSFLGQVLSAGMGKLKEGYDHAIEAMQEVGEDENMKIDHKLSYMGLVGSVSPMIGLFGTVDGMIRSFRVIATSPTAPKPSELAEGISTALVTTIVGLFIAIPAIATYNILRNRFQRLVLEVGIVSGNLMGRFQKK